MGDCMEQKFLPVGSVVLLKEATRPIVIIGYMIAEDGAKDVWDYMGCAYPIGVVRNDRNLLFQKDQIDKILFKGYMDDEGNKFLEDLEESVEHIINE